MYANRLPVPSRLFWRAALLLAGLIVVMIGVGGPSLSRAQVTTVDQMEASTVRILCEDEDGQLSTGSGFVIGGGQHVATNFHVIDCLKDNGKAVVVVGPNEMVPVVEVPWYSTTRGKDLAVLTVARSLDRPAVTFNPDAHVRQSQRVYALGFPGAADRAGGGSVTQSTFFAVKWTEGIVSAKVRDSNGLLLYQISAGINPGNSGGPLFNQCGQVVGINVRKSYVNLDGVNVTQGDDIGWSIRADELIDALQAEQIPAAVANEPCLLSGDTGNALDRIVQRRTEALQRRFEAQRKALLAELEQMRTRAEAESAAARQRRDSLNQALTTVNTTLASVEDEMATPWRHALPLAALVVAAVAVAVAFTKRGRVVVREVAQKASNLATRTIGGGGARDRRPKRPRRQPVLVGLQEGHAGERYDLGKGAVHFGRDPTFAGDGVLFAADAAGISKRHCTLRYDRTRRRFQLEDHSSSYGTFRGDGTRVPPDAPQVLPEGSRFYLGSREHLFEVRFDDAP